jgi:Zn-dependent peptidase ImmA (M78 family)
MHVETDEIESRALSVISQAAALSLPIDLVRVAHSLDVQIHFQTFEDEVSGVLLIQGDERHVMVNKSHHPNRQRFSIAHELGHLVLHDTKGDRLFIDTHLRLYQRVGASTSKAYSESGSATTPQEEREANQFAAALLMPKPLLEDAALSRDLWDEFDVSALAATFAVSEQAMAIRLQQLDVVNPILAQK